eukprot:gene5201-10405_t
MSVAISANFKSEMLKHGHVYEGYITCFGFIDCTNTATCQPGGGPVIDGPKVEMKGASLYNDDANKYYFFEDSAYTSAISFDGGAIHTYYKDSPYRPLTERQKSENKAMKTCRQSIEWEYGLIKSQYKLMDCKHSLKLRLQDVGDMILLLFFLLMNAYCCLNGTETSSHFLIKPPTLQEWTAQGPKRNVVYDAIEAAMSI